MRCPACTEAELDKLGNCSRCKGIWLAEELVERQAASALEVTGGGYSERHCPTCDEKMDEPLIFGVPIDRCEGHGMWFDKAELAEVIRRSGASDWRDDPEPSPEDSLRGLVAAVDVWRRS